MLLTLRLDVYVQVTNDVNRQSTEGCRPDVLPGYLPLMLTYSGKISHNHGTKGMRHAGQDSGALLSLRFRAAAAQRAIM